MTTYSSQDDIAKYLKSAAVGDVFIAVYNRHQYIRVVTGVKPHEVSFVGVIPAGRQGSYDTFSGTWDTSAVISLTLLGNDLDDVKSQFPELFI